MSNWISTKKELPKLNTYYLIHVTRDTWGDNDDDPHFKVAKFVKKDNGEYYFEEFGVDGYSLSEVDYWHNISRDIPEIESGKSLTFLNSATSSKPIYRNHQDLIDSFKKQMIDLFQELKGYQNNSAFSLIVFDEIERLCETKFVPSQVSCKRKNDKFELHFRLYNGDPTVDIIQVYFDKDTLVLNTVNTI